MRRLSVLVRIIVFSTVQAISTLLVIFSFPFAQINHGVIDIINEVLLTIASCLMIYLEKESRWNNYTEKLFLSVIMAGNFIVTFIMLIVLAKTIWRKIKEYRANRYTITVKPIKIGKPKTNHMNKEDKSNISKSHLELKRNDEEVKFEQEEKGNII